MTHQKIDSLFEFIVWLNGQARPVMPDDHSKVVPLLPIPNRTVKRLSADDSADARVKVGHRQAFILKTLTERWAFFLCVHDVVSGQGTRPGSF